MDSASWSRLALWLEPTPADAEAVHTVMARVRSWASSPCFGVHMTLLSGLTRGGTLTAPQIQQMWEQVLSTSQAWQAGCSGSGLLVPLLPPTSRGTYYQSLVFPLQPTQALLELHAAMRGALALPEREFWPHVSLAYTDLGRQAQGLACRLEQEGWRSNFAPNFSLTFSNLSLWSCAGPAEEWHKLHEVRLADL